jgi:diadenosine tetraphosphate (Ap4A) HIT family hydrolase
MRVCAKFARSCVIMKGSRKLVLPIWFIKFHLAYSESSIAIVILPLEVSMGNMIIYITDMSVEQNTPSLLKGPCHDCGFSIYIPLADLGGIATLGLYNDRRFPGRSVLALNEHYSTPEDLPYDLHMKYSAAALLACRAIADVTGARPINFATLCNRVSHVHSHIIPRQLDNEPRPDDPPWNDPRQKLPMPEARVAELRAGIIDALRLRFAEQDVLAELNVVEAQ